MTEYPHVNQSEYLSVAETDVSLQKFKLNQDLKELLLLFNEAEL